MTSPPKPFRAIVPTLLLMLPLALGASALLGCAEQAELAVTVCGDLVVPEDVDTIRISSRDADGSSSLGGVVELLECPSGQTTQLPIDYVIPAEEGERWIVAQALRDGVEVGRVETRVSAASSGTTSVTLQLARSCLGTSCPLGQTCLGGTCEITPFAATEPMDCTVEPAEGEPEPEPGPDPDPEPAPAPDVSGGGDAGSDAAPGPTVHPYCVEGGP